MLLYAVSIATILQKRKKEKSTTCDNSTNYTEVVFHMFMKMYLCIIILQSLHLLLIAALKIIILNSILYDRGKK